MKFWNGGENVRAGSRLPVIGVVSLVALLVAFYCAFRAIVYLNTVYPPGFHCEAFNAIKPGDNLQSTLKRVGLPFYMSINFTAGGIPIGIKLPTTEDIEIHVRATNENVILQYSICSHRFGDEFRDLSVTFHNGSVIRKRDEIYHEFW
jgi:hypothetical protein